MYRTPIRIAMTKRSTTIRCLAILILFSWFGSVKVTSATETDTRDQPPPPLRIVVLPFQITPNAATNDWAEGFLTLLRSGIVRLESCEVLSGKKTRSFSDAAGLSVGATPDGQIARRIATAAEADVVVWGRVDGVGTRRTVSASLVRAGSETAPTLVEAEASTWAELAELLTFRFSEQLERRLHEDDHKEWRRIYSGSDEALQPLARLVTLEVNQAPESDREQLLRATLKADPSWEWAQSELLSLLEQVGREEEHQAAAAEYQRLHPESCNAHLLRAWELFSTNKAAAEREFREALRVHRGCPGAAYGFWLLHGATENWKTLSELLEGIHRDRPDSLRTRILLALARLRVGDRRGATDLLEQLNRLPEEDEEVVELALLAASLGCGRFDLAGRELTRLGPKAAESSMVRGTLASFRLDTPADNTGNAGKPITRPRSFTSTELQSELERRLSATERQLLQEPIERTPEILAEAQRLTRGLSNEPMQAIALFAEVVRRGRGAGDGGTRTARQALEASESVPVKLSCQEHAKLFVSLARALGIDAWIVHVDRDAFGRPGLHDCATVFLDGHGLLVDPTWNMVGLPHQEFSVLDDLQAISHQAMQVGEKPDPVKLRAGLKLNPDDRWTQLQFVTGMARAGEFNEALIVLDKVRATSAGRWDVHTAGADFEMARREWKLAQAELLRALALSPSNALVHARLVSVYSQLKDSQKIKEHLVAALEFDRGELTEDLRRSGQAELEIMNVHQRAQADDPQAVGELQRLAAAGEAGAMYALARLHLEANPPQVNESLAWLKKAAELGGADAQFDYARNLLSLKGESAAPEAVMWLSRAAEQGEPKAQFNLGSIFYNGEGVEKDYGVAVKWLRRAAEQNVAEAKSALGSCYLYGHGILKDEAEAVKLFREAAEQNDANGQFNLAVCYEQGTGVEKDLAKALEWYSRAAGQNLAQAQLNLGSFYLNGSGVKPDYSEALKWYRKAADQDFPRAQLYLGNFYYFGHGVEKDYAEAVKWHRKAAEQNDATAQLNLGDAYYYAQGVEKDYVQAVKWYRKAAEQNDAKAQFALGNAYYNGEGVEQDYAESVKWFRKAAEQNDSAAQFSLGNVYYFGRSVDKDYAEAVKWHRKAAEQNSPQSQHFMGFAYANGHGVEKDPTEALKWFRKAAEQKDPESQFFVGNAYYFGKGVEQDYAEGVKWFRKAAEQNDSAAQFSLGNAYYFGRGVDKDYAEAVKWHRKAAEQNNDRSQQFMGFAYANGHGVETSFAEAYAWGSLAAPTQENATKLLEDLEKQMSPPQLVEAFKRKKELRAIIDANAKPRGE